MNSTALVQLTETDRQILRSYQSMLEGLSDYLGSGYEIVLHSLENLDQSVIRIFNGHYTGRKEGAPITDLALEMLERLNHQYTGSYITYSSKNRQGDPIKSSTIAIYGENHRIIGLLCMNYYLNLPLSTFIQENYFPENYGALSETFAENATEIVEKTVYQIRDEVLSDRTVPYNAKNREIICRLSNRGIFNLKDAVPTVAELLNISKNTVYLHLRNCQS